ncbi:MAG: class B sortase [Oscillospiraceae bacterium]|nr:class B sortase [Oscillospiraceae bacterium]
MQKNIYTALTFVFFAVFLICSAFSVNNLFFKTAAADSAAEDPTDINAEDVYSPRKTNLLGDLKVNTGDVTYMQDMLGFFKPLYAYNQDTVGWLRVPNTSIDTVVMHNTNDNGRTGDYFYLRNDFYKVYSRYGNVFLDYRCRKYDLSQNTILYGHAIPSGEQAFNDLNKYKNIDFFKANPIVEYGTLYNNYKWKVFTVFLTTVEAPDDNGYVFNYIYPSMGPNSFAGYLAAVRERELYRTGVDVAPTDKILTLSTCDYDFNAKGQKISARLVVVARMLREGESEAIDLSAVTGNPGYRRPQRWYSLMGQSNPYANSPRWTPSDN